ncbi:preprotein translocase subunit SecA [Mycolicibacterium phlei]|uniref:Protein translocase subunit SecA n=2 Tax=Mycolicibacterium phlei TaxID=1771 RepID=A0A5N5V3I5_MYCPH|nr:preprotein translocase subunit SecA [Mycolicibacterium phlei]EID17638.1 preprotein translocase subunit SecA [Mycolicibacterium phlei RIVM601174]KAB7756493.1 preprotein translocase subunit SecA [Mycolicibacterium phlei DSM 43239 = CCUG 21000]KXW61916.1 preprotein translocase subunit SecA [Mycolicibacterium phlei DSM 43072]KXW63380.1 preprotein translocase subunit SecA [Mycolicibacterium phlei DSM 43239 = CCUG 21000]KXW73234.1 preprotein translocase subunit SecA [Mycolicibacterium phlei DSM 4
MLQKLLRLGEGRMVKRLNGVADYVDSLAGDYEKLTDAELRAKTDEFRKRIDDGESLDDLLPEAFAVAREASWRVRNQRHFHVQVMGGAALHFGNVAEMKTGEGKTLTAVLPAYLNALSGKGVHIVTVNDYLAKRDAEQMGRVHRFLGLSVGVILSGMTPDERRAAYAADITYGTNNEFGFDYLRDNMAHSLADLVQRGHNYAIVDEVDSILIDEARTPLIISGPADGASHWYQEFARLAPMMEKDVHYEVDLRKRTVGVHELGVEFVEDQLGIDNLYEAANSPLVSYLNNALKAKELFHRDKDYIVRNGEVLIVDEFTGRVLVGRRYNEGMHQAIEAKEGVEIKAENQTLATITLQNYFRLYDKLAGMTGTAQTEAAELHEIYKLGVVPIPTNKPMIRVDHSDLIYKTEEAKYLAVVDDVVERYEKGQPVLIGTTSVERSEYLSRQFQKRRIPHNVLNAKYHEQEAAIIAEAGRRGAITVATNMAGRGTDIVLGGNPDFLVDKRLREQGLDPVTTPDEYEQAWHEMLPKVKEECAREAEEVIAAGGLYVLGTERHESRRIDNQLRGRSGRQGDPGESRFYLSLGDELMRRFNGATLEALLTRLNLPDDVPIEAKMVTRAIKSAQTQVEQQNFEIRKQVLKYDEVMNQQRKVIYEERRRILEGENLRDQALGMIRDVITAYVEGATAEGYAEDWDLEQLWTALRQLYPISVDHHDLIDSDAVGEPGELTREELLEVLIADAERAYEERERQIDEIAGEGAMRQLERNVLLNVLDRKWREHLYEMDYLKEGIGLRAMAQRDPLVEYQREGYDMFIAMLEGLKEESVGFLFNVQVEPAPQPTVAPVATPSGLAEFAKAAAAQAQAAGQGGVATEARPAPAGLRAKGIDDNENRPLTYSGPSEDGSTQVQRSGNGGGRHAAQQGGTRKERREAARQQARDAKSMRRR